MILYALACEAGHRFEAWFHDSGAFDEQSGRGLVECPACRSSSVVKAIMAPAVLGGRDVSGKMSIGVPTEGPPLLDDRQVAVRALVRAYRDKVFAVGEDVGARFPEEARQMHDQEIPQRHIYGRATREEATSLLEDGILVLPLPTMPEELN